MTHDNKCDMCGRTMEFDTIEIVFGYGSDFDESTLDFCSDLCLKAWVIMNIGEAIK